MFGGNKMLVNIVILGVFAIATIIAEIYLYKHNDTKDESEYTDYLSDVFKHK